MIQEFIDKFIEAKPETETWLREEDGYFTYEELIERIVLILYDERRMSPDPYRIHKIDDGDYQGTLIFVIGATGYQPSEYWVTNTYYGSCGGCDALEAAQDFSHRGNRPDQQVRDIYTLMLHLVQRLKPINHKLHDE